jgi:hypothetical protein
MYRVASISDTYPAAHSPQVVVQQTISREIRPFGKLLITFFHVLIVDVIFQRRISSSSMARCLCGGLDLPPNIGRSVSAFAASGEVEILTTPA